jgi:hypothetical protein
LLTCNHRVSPVPSSRIHCYPHAAGHRHLTTRGHRHHAAFHHHAACLHYYSVPYLFMRPTLVQHRNQRYHSLSNLRLWHSRDPNRNDHTSLTYLHKRRPIVVNPRYECAYLPDLGLYLLEKRVSKVDGATGAEKNDWMLPGYIDTN